MKLWSPLTIEAGHLLMHGVISMGWTVYTVLCYSIVPRPIFSVTLVFRLVG